MKPHKLRNTMIRRAAAPILAAAMMLSGNSAFALASGSVVFDPSNWAENLRAATTGIKQLTQEYAQTKQLIETVRHAVNNSEALVTGVLFDAMGADQRSAAIEATKFYDALRTLEKDLGSLQSRYDQKVNAAFNSKRTVAEFMELTRKEAQRGVKAAQLSIDQDLQTLKRVQKTYDSVQEWQVQAGASLGHQQSLQLMNTQMNALVGQNAEIITALTKASMERTIADANKREEQGVSDARRRALDEESRRHFLAAEAEMAARIKAVRSPSGQK